MPNINDFISNFVGGARPSKFRAIINYPSVVTRPAVQDYIVCHNAILPSSTVSPTQVFFQGRAIPIPGDRQNEPMSLTFVNDTTFAHKFAFEEWLNAINAHQANIQASANYQDLVGTVQVQQLDRDDTVLATYNFINCFPDTMSQIDLDYSQQDVVEQFTVTFAYAYWSNSSTTS